MAVAAPAGVAPPVLTTARLRLVPRTLADFDDCLAMDRRPGVTDHIAGPWADPAAHRAFVRDRITRAYPPGLGYWTLRPHAAPDRFLGWVLLIPEDAVGPAVEIGWRLVPEAWGRGLASEAAAVLLAYGFADVGLDTVVSDIRPEHEASRRVAEKVGMVATGRIDDGDGHELIRYRADRPSPRRPSPQAPPPEGPPR